MFVISERQPLRRTIAYQTRNSKPASEPSPFRTGAAAPDTKGRPRRLTVSFPCEQVKRSRHQAECPICSAFCTRGGCL
jgi:hypothetical protein